MIEIEEDEEITVLKFDNPPMNAICKEMLEEMDDVLEKLKNDKIRTAILTGKGDSFIAGADIKEMKEMEPAEARCFSRKGQKLFNKLEKLSFPVIGAVNGYALGGGLELALSCDFLLASEKALFGQPEVGLGVIPGFGGTYNLAESIGSAKAKELIFTGKRIQADKAKEWGIVNRVVPPEELMNEARDLAEEIVNNSPIAVAKAKKAINQGRKKSKEGALRTESDRFEECFKFPDRTKGMEAFLENRDPDF
ncbi:MAG: enoyl-CoA hydratase-related protein [Candidatus Thermoplasmatota archaeon]